jgi:AcrR family transcriptional regulator
MAAKIHRRRKFVNEMSPRKYDMGKRAAAVQDTRRRIVDAARALHIEQGITATSWEDIAARAGVGVGTVYRHFRSLDELVPACGQVSMEAIALPQPSAASRVFDGVEGAARMERLVAEAFSIYERGAPDLRVVRRERGVHPSVKRAAEDLEASLAALIDAALEPLGAEEDERRVVRAMLDLGTWEALRAQGFAPAGAVSVVAQMLAARPLRH